MGYEANIEEKQTLFGKIVEIPKVDKTLTKENHAADSKVVGDKLAAQEKEITAIKNNALIKQNNIVQGPIHTQNFDNGYGSVNKNHSATADYGTQIVDRSKDGKNAHLDICALLNTLNFVGTDGEANKVFHEGVKPFGFYNGNGNANERVIDTNGIGRLILVYNIYHFSFVTPEGALVITLADGTIKWIESTKSYFLNGKLTLATNNAAFNESNTTYYYQVI